MVLLSDNLSISLSYGHETSTPPTWPTHLIFSVSLYSHVRLTSPTYNLLPTDYNIPSLYSSHNNPFEKSKLPSLSNPPFLYIFINIILIKFRDLLYIEMMVGRIRFIFVTSILRSRHETDVFRPGPTDDIMVES